MPNFSIMKKLYILLFLVSMHSNAQSLVVSPDGFVDSTNTNNNYLTLKFEDVSNEEIYKRAYISLSTYFRTSKYTMDDNENKSITIHANYPKQIRKSDSHTFDMNYQVIINFSDSKITLAINSLKMTTTDKTNKPQTLVLYRRSNDILGNYFGVFKKGGEVRYPLAVEDLNAFSEEVVSMIKKGISQNKIDFGS